MGCYSLCPKFLSKVINKMNKERDSMEAHVGTPSPRLESLVRDRIAERRFSALAAAVREHQARAARQYLGERPHDDALYRRLRQICGEV
jgi:hypothetical protein